MLSSKLCRVILCIGYVVNAASIQAREARPIPAALPQLVVPLREPAYYNADAIKKALKDMKDNDPELTIIDHADSSEISCPPGTPLDPITTKLEQPAEMPSDSTAVQQDDRHRWHTIFLLFIDKTGEDTGPHVHLHGELQLYDDSGKTTEFEKKLHEESYFNTNAENAQFFKTHADTDYAPISTYTVKLQEESRLHSRYRVIVDHAVLTNRTFEEGVCTELPDRRHCFQDFQVEKYGFAARMVRCVVYNSPM